MNVLSELQAALRPILADLAGDPDELLDMIRPAQDPKFGDYQANCAMPLGKRLGRPPREIAREIADRVELDHLCETPEIAGPGFINLRLKDDWLVGRLADARRDDRLGVARVDEPRRFVIDYSSPNVAKPMHVGHIRSTVIGDALCRTLRFLGHEVVGDNHLGDWGTQFGMIIFGFKHFVDRAAYEDRPVEELARLYKLVRKLVDFVEGNRKLPELREKIGQQEGAVAGQRTTAESESDKKAAKTLRKMEAQLAEMRSRADELESSLAATRDDPKLGPLAEQHTDVDRAVLDETARLHAGDAENKRLWNEFLPKCRDDIQRVYDRLGVSFDVEHGESFYHDALAPVVDSLREKGLAEVSQGAVCVFLDGFDTPMIVRKKDGAFLYATTDLATVRYRIEQWNPDAILYVVDFRQGEHFAKLFDTVHAWIDPRLELAHVSFGTVLGEDGRPFKTRSGDTVGLEGLLDESVARALRVVGDNDDAKPGGPELSEEQRREVARRVGIAAIKYADLSQNRTSDYVFSYEKMLAMNGNTATYMQYSYARVQSIFARGGIDVAKLRASDRTISFSHAAERSLALQLLRFSEVLDETAVDYRPNHLTAYLFDLAKRYSTFFENCPVLKAENEALRESRLLLCDLTARTLKRGLELLGIEVVEKM